MNFLRTYRLRFRATTLLGLAGLSAGLSLTACQSMGLSMQGANPPPVVPAAPPPPMPHVAALLPISGPNGALGHVLLQAAQLALESPRSPVLDVIDTGGTPSGAAQAAQRAVAQGDALIIGPLTARETAAVTPITQMAHIPVLAFTNDSRQGRIGVWPLGITPGQQVGRLLQAVSAHNANRLAAVLPESRFGDELASAYTHVPQAATPPLVRRYTDQVGALAALHGLADANGQPSCDALLISESGQRLGILAPTLATLHLAAPQVRLLGPDLWAKEANQSALAGAWYASPDPQLRQDFEQRYMNRFHATPPRVADMAYDAASLARVLGGDGTYTLPSLERHSGFAGVDGVFVLRADGHVQRSLAVFEIGQAGPRLIEASPTDPTAAP